MTNYCTASDLITFGVNASLAEDSLSFALDTASRIIDNYCGTTFSPVTGTRTISDVRLPIVVPPRPFSNVTAVTINAVGGSAGYSVNTSNIVTEYDSFGNPKALRLYYPGIRDADGFPTSTSYIRNRAGYGNEVSVTATFGYATPPSPVKRACVRLAANIATQSVADLLPDGNINQIDVEGYRLILNSGGAIDTTGDSVADQLLRPYRNQATAVA